jgi:hypothetical protein
MMALFGYLQATQMMVAADSIPGNKCAAWLGKMSALVAYPVLDGAH